MRTSRYAMLLLGAMLLAACTWTGNSEPSDLILGTWQMDRATESMTSTGGTSGSHELQGYDDYTMEFVEEGYCAVVDRGERTVYEWYLVGADTLVMVRQGLAESHYINELTKKRLVYSDSYCAYDSVTHGTTSYIYTFEYSKK